MPDSEVTLVGENGIVKTVYVASINIRGTQVDLGNFDTFEEAELAVLAEEARAPSDTKRCHDCNGSGQRKDDDCNLCSGTGRLPK